MRGIKKVQILCLILSLVVCLGVWAQSPTYNATASIFETDADNFYSVHDYSTLEFDKGFVFAGLEIGNYLNLGLATNIGSVYIGARYKGKILDGFSGSDTLETTTIDVITTDSILLTTSVKDEHKLSNSLNMDTSQTGGILIGIANMGFRLSYTGHLYSRNATIDPVSENVSTSTSVTNKAAGYKKNDTFNPDGYYKNGLAYPSLTWGMTLPLGSLTLKPLVAFGVAMNSDSFFAERTQKETINDNAILGTTTSSIKVNYKNMDLQFAPQVGAELAFDNGSLVSLYYSIAPRVYTSSYTDKAGATVKVKGRVENYSTKQTVEETATSTVTVDTTDISTVEKSILSHGLNLAYKATKSLNDRVSVGFATGASASYMTISKVEKETQTVVTTTDTKGDDPAADTVKTVTKTFVGYNAGSGGADRGITYEEKDFTLTPSLKTGITFAAVPNKFSVNFGYDVTLPKFKSVKTTWLFPSVGTKTETTEVDGNGKTITSSVAIATPARAESSTLATTWWTVATTFTTGLCWNLTDKIALDTKMTLGLPFSIDTVKATAFDMALSVKF